MAAQSDEDVRELGLQLKAALHEYCEKLRQLAIASFPEKEKVADPYTRATLAAVANQDF
jgi:hypothetical protein